MDPLAKVDRCFEGDPIYEVVEFVVLRYRSLSHAVRNDARHPNHGRSAAHSLARRGLLAESAAARRRRGPNHAVSCVLP